MTSSVRLVPSSSLYVTTPECADPSSKPATRAVPENAGRVGVVVPVGPEVHGLAANQDYLGAEIAEPDEKPLRVLVRKLGHYRNATIRMRLRGNEKAPFSALTCRAVFNPDATARASRSREASFWRARCFGLNLARMAFLRVGRLGAGASLLELFARGKALLVAAKGHERLAAAGWSFELPCSNRYLTCVPLPSRRAARSSHPESGGPCALGVRSHFDESEHLLGQSHPARYRKRTALTDGKRRKNKWRGNDRLRQLLRKLPGLPFPSLRHGLQLCKRNRPDIRRIGDRKIGHFLGG
jgi:hypothetical protein